MMSKKRLKEYIAFSIFRIISFLIVGILILILSFIIVRGISVINLKFLTEMPSEGMEKGGILPAIVGTFCLVIGSMIFAFPIGVYHGLVVSCSHRHVVALR